MINISEQVVEFDQWLSQTYGIFLVTRRSYKEIGELIRFSYSFSYVYVRPQSRRYYIFAIFVCIMNTNKAVVSENQCRLSENCVETPNEFSRQTLLGKGLSFLGCFRRRVLTLLLLTAMFIMTNKSKMHIQYI